MILQLFQEKQARFGKIFLPQRQHFDYQKRDHLQRKNCDRMNAIWRLLDISKEYKLINKIILFLIVGTLVLPFIMLLIGQLNHSPSVSYVPKCFVEEQTGHPCPTCGLTRSILLLYEGHLKKSIAQYAYGYLFVLILFMQLFFRLILVLHERAWIPYVDIAQMMICGVFWYLIIH